MRPNATLSTLVNVDRVRSSIRRLFSGEVIKGQSAPLQSCVRPDRRPQLHDMLKTVSVYAIIAMANTVFNDSLYFKVETTMIEIPYTADYRKNLERHGMREALPCIVCGRAVKAKNPALLRIFWGTHIVTDEEASRIIASEGEGGDLCYYPIGPDCLRRHPEIKPYVKRFASETVREST